ncbi:NfeD family protein [Sphingomonas canadensis]|nr:NfeD family protein [Sphingomonas canadensis]MCW3836735.1 NfeD family protein [Sphingomonas canadensis]
MTEILETPGLSWLILAGVLARVELLVPGIFLVFVAAGAAVTGAAVLLFPGMSFFAEMALFAVATATAVAIGRRWYLRNPVPSADPLLNDRAARLVGETVPVVEAIVDGHGRVKVGDGEWLAHGPDVPAGARVRITGADGATLTVEPVAVLASGG